MDATEASPMECDQQPQQLPLREIAQEQAQAYEPAPSRSKKGRTKRGGSEPGDLVHLSGPIPNDSERLQRGWRPVRLSRDEKAAQIVLDEEQLQATSSKGYRMVRATHGAHEGTWYYEVQLVGLPASASAAARIGWATCRAELQAPVGYDTYGYAYRSKEGSKVHAGWRDEYGEGYEEGDVIGCLIHMPPGGDPLEKKVDDAVRHKGKVYYVDSGDEEKEPEPNAQPLPGSFVAFTRNGQLQGKAYVDIREGTYYPAVSLYTDAREWGDAMARCNFGEEPFAHPPPQMDGCPAPRAVCDIAGPKPEGWIEEKDEEKSE